MSSQPVDTAGVFINTPYDKGYEPLFVTLVGTLVLLGQEPHCVLEIRETGQGRLQRIYEQLHRCRMSIHDLSRVGNPVRFNMPFELGLACGIAISDPEHQVVVLDAKPYRLDKLLSDYKGRDPLIHHNRCDDLVTCLLDLLVSDVAETPLPSVSDLRKYTKLLRASARRIRREMRIETIFRPAAYRALMAASTELAQTEGLISP